MTRATSRQIKIESESIMTTDGDLLYYNSEDTALPIGTEGQVLTVASGLPAWEDAPEGSTSWNEITGSQSDVKLEYFTDGTGYEIIDTNNQLQPRGIVYSDKGAFVSFTAQSTGGFRYFLRSTDSGETWEQVSYPNNDTDYVWSFSSGDNGVILGSIFNKDTIVRSTDGGETWSTATSLPASIGTDSYVKYGNGVWIVYNDANDYYYRSTDNGDTWSTISDPIGTGDPVTAVGTDGSGKWYMISLNLVDIYVSTDDALTWSDSGQNKVASLGDDTIITGNGKGVWIIYGDGSDDWLRSDDNGASWTQMDNVTSGSDLGAIINNGSNEFLLVSGSNQVYNSTDFGETWTFMFNNGADFSEGAATDSNGVWILAGDNSSDNTGQYRKVKQNQQRRNNVEQFTVNGEYVYPDFEGVLNFDIVSGSGATDGGISGLYIADRNETYYATLGTEAIDLSIATSGSGYGAGGDQSVAIGNDSTASDIYSIAIGNLSKSSVGGGVAIGQNAQVNTSSTYGLAVGGNALVESNAVYGVALGYQARIREGCDYSIAIGYQSGGNVDDVVEAISIGRGATAYSDESIAIGKNSYVGASSTGAIAIGSGAQAASGQIALGDTGSSVQTSLRANQYTWNIDQTLSASEDGYVMTYNNSSGELELQAASGGGGSADTFQSIYDADATGITSTDSNSTFDIDLEVGGTGFAWGLNNTISQFPDNFQNKNNLIVNHNINDNNPIREYIKGTVSGDFKIADEVVFGTAGNTLLHELYGVNRSLFGSFSNKEVHSRLITASGGIQQHPDFVLDGSLSPSISSGSNLQVGTGSSGSVAFGDPLGVSNSTSDRSLLYARANEPIQILQFGDTEFRTLVSGFSDGSTTVYASDTTGVVDLSALSLGGGGGSTPNLESVVAVGNGTPYLNDVYSSPNSNSRITMNLDDSNNFNTEFGIKINEFDSSAGSLNHISIFTGQTTYWQYNDGSNSGYSSSFVGSGSGVNFSDYAAVIDLRASNSDWVNEDRIYVGGIPNNALNHGINIYSDYTLIETPTSGRARILLSDDGGNQGGSGLIDISSSNQVTIGDTNGTYIDIDNLSGLISLIGLPTSDPLVSGALWDDSGYIAISAG